MKIEFDLKKWVKENETNLRDLGWSAILLILVVLSMLIGVGIVTSENGAVYFEGIITGIFFAALVRLLIRYS